MPDLERDRSVTGRPVSREFAEAATETYEDVVAHARALAQQESDAAWGLGDDALKVVVRYSEHSLENFAGDTGVAYETLKQYRRVSEAYPEKGTRVPNSWKVCQTFAAQSDRVKLVTSRKWTVAEARDELKRRSELSAPRLREEVSLPLPAGEGGYRTLVIHPPWPETGPAYEHAIYCQEPGEETCAECSTVECQVARLLRDSVADDCHLYIWTTHRAVPDALELAEAWGFTYECLLTWLKDGVTPSPDSWLPDTVHILFARRGNQPLAGEAESMHFTTPEGFYEKVCTVSPEPRLEMFGSTSHDGFELLGA